MRDIADVVAFGFKVEVAQDGDIVNAFFDVVATGSLKIVLDEERIDTEDGGDAVFRFIGGIMQLQ